MHSVYDWLKSNAAWLIPLALYVIANVKNGLSKHPQAQSALGKVLDILCFLTHSDSPGTLKAPLIQESQAPGKLRMAK